MPRRGARDVSSEPKHCLFGGYLHIPILGLMLFVCFPIYSHMQVSAESCTSKNLSAKYQHCGVRSDGVRNLDCFGKHRREDRCAWEPGRHGPQKSYTLILQQPPGKYCKVLHNITELFTNIQVFARHNLTAEVFENMEQKNCTKAVFRGSPKSWARCDAPTEVLPTRPPGALQVNVTWFPKDAKYISKFSLRYKVLGDDSWNETVRSQYPNTVRLEKLNSSLTYVVQIRCVTSVECSQCPWSKNYIVPSELLSQPIVVSSKHIDIGEKPGCRLISITWKFPAKEPYDGYLVTIWKRSGERPQEQLTTSEPQIKLVLSYSAYQLNISAYNNASKSPAVAHIVPQHEVNHNLKGGWQNVTVHNRTAFTIHWRRDLIRSYVCFSVEWMKKGDRAFFRSFFEDSNTHKTLSPLPEHLEPYKRYKVSLQLRPDKNTCNMKHINNSEITYGTTEFYHIEGSPVSAPANISFCNVTANSAALQWSQIREEDMRGFLLGYIIHYTEYNRETSAGHNITVDPGYTYFNMESLKSGTAYQVQISGFTSAGEGTRSAPSVFKTHHKVHFSISGVVTSLVVLVCLLVFGSLVIKRGKAIMWPSIPNPGYSNAVQTIESPAQLELLKALAHLRVEEWDAKSFQILEKEAAMPALLRNREDDPPETAASWAESDTDSATEDSLHDDAVDGLLDTQRTHSQSCALAFAGGYTTMEMFQQTVPRGLAADTADAPSIQSTQEDFTVWKSTRLEYVQQFSTSPPSDTEHMSTIL